MAVHINSLLATAKNVHCTSEWFTDIVGTNPVNIWKILVQLKKAGFGRTSQYRGHFFAYRARLLNVYRAVEVMKEEALPYP
ncbi:hypothetical protein P4H71_17340 [Paenibacillus kribbensis]|uniref:hypothetical protein n=1 Tax=Paenibacillus kribbensis TaxID=172713 RepID=UPI002DBE40A3|nr:hypothetical protein [Paenibacillus kribbensis]MEC0236097.1 hypothetical protein [Paenibacillus kribbensis]